MKKTFLFIAASCFIILVNAQTEPAPKPPQEDFVGKYIFPEGSVVPDVTVAISGSDLHMSSEAGASILSELGIDSFQIIEFSGIAVFKRGDDKKVNGVHIEAQGYVLDGKKESSSGSWVFTIYIKPNRELLLAKR
ncbi:MAG TPA: hypothetical protein VJ765_03170 [Chitinophagaceae bacterium]|nr:hypothetical protein [Chitinophagaceae bacterium]